MCPREIHAKLTRRRNKRKRQALTLASESPLHPSRVAAGRFLIWATAFLILGIYLLHAAPSAWWGDGQELACAAWTIGIPHPTGYPLYTVLGHLWMKLATACSLTADPGQALTWMSALFLAIALG